MTKANGTIRSRIVGESEESPASLRPHPMNPRQHSEAQQVVIKESLRELGWVDRVIANKRTRHIINGHCRVEAAIAEGVPKIPVLWVSLTKADELKALAILDRSAEMADVDTEKMSDLVAAVSVSSDELAEMLGIVDDADLGELADPEPQLDRAEELREQWGVELGQLWEVPSKAGKGCHRLLCGDAKPMDSSSDALITDPPYGIGVDGSWYGGEPGPGMKHPKSVDSPFQQQQPEWDKQAFDPKPFAETTKPVAMFGAFLGSGTTMVAAEQLGRLCYGIEIEPKYVAVALQRLADLGLEPRRAAI